MRVCTRDTDSYLQVDGQQGLQKDKNPVAQPRGEGDDDHLLVNRRRPRPMRYFISIILLINNSILKLKGLVCILVCLILKIFKREDVWFGLSAEVKGTAFVSVVTQSHFDAPT